MRQWKILCTTAVVALVSGNAALADVTPEQVWENWKAVSTSYGQTLTTASEAREGNALVVKGITMTSKQDGAEATMLLDQAIFTDQGNGSVVMTMSETSKMEVKTPAVEETPATTSQISIANPGMTVTVSGTPEAMRYEFVGPSVTLSLDSIDGGGEVPDDMKVEAVLTGLKGSYDIAGTTDKTIASNATLDGLAIGFSGSDPAEGSKVNGSVNLAGIAATSNSAMFGDMANMAAALKAGTKMDGDITYQSASMDITVVDASGETKVQGTNAGGALNFAMDAARLAYGGTVKDASVTLSGGQLPFPQVNLAYKEGAFDLVMPLQKSDTPADFSFMTKIADLTISDEVWGMLDPAAQLPRDPITVHLDTTGKVKLNADLMDEAAMGQMEANPGELHALDLKALEVKFGGAQVTGNGAMTFDNTDLATYGGVPAPTGTVDLKAVGLNGLLDKLMAMGLVPEDQMMGARMMLGMFAKMVEGEPDTMTSKVEFKDKHLFVNGMQLQ
ncbi:DUF2125 domain-containing protein [Gemmobacter serpentinus]|uniref:DUF2125 domain-containing protein n=1 Tax=Gemmobacter serpentinus TaxID=2652247 RepID=UPI00124EB55B|nr:DUF2125 domain-containing protein [Gemmobacter serpentinus]